MAKRNVEGCPLNMTPMIDVVFQLMIFFLVTINMEETVNPDIELEKAPHSPEIEGSQQAALVIEVDKSGKISLRNVGLTKEFLRNMVQTRFNKQGAFPVVIRGDRRAQHKDIREVMDICTAVGLYQIQFSALKELRK